jgi:hypothetical protein
MKMIAVLILFVFPVLVHAQNTDAPDWINNSAYIENEILFFVGYSKSTMIYRMTFQLAQSNALKNLIQMIQNNELLELPPIPADAKSRSTFTNITDNGEVSGTISDISIIEEWEDNDGGIYVLCSCTGVELNHVRESSSKYLEETDLMELYLYALELGKQTLEG